MIQSSYPKGVFRSSQNRESLGEQWIGYIDCLASGFVNGDPIGKVQCVDGFAKTSRIFTGDVALWMLDAVKGVASSSGQR